MRYNSVLHNIKTLNERYQGSPLYKHINWNSAANKFLLNKDFMVQENNNEHSAIFIPLVAATVRNVIDEISFADSVPINFNDPWYVKDQYDNQSGMGDFLSFPSPYNPTGKYNQSVGGVFLNQNPTFDPTLPNYSVKAISPQDIPLQHSGKTHRFYFQNWEYDPNKIDLEHPEELETGVVFKDQNVVLKANMKGTQLSNEINAYTNNNQRKFVRGFSQLGGGYFNTYRSMDKVWLEFNDNTGWVLLNNGKPLSDNESKNPSIDYWEKDALETFAFVVYQEKNNGDGYSIKIKVFNQDNINVLYDGEVVNESTESFQTDANPVIAVGKGFDNIYINTLMVCWYKKEDSGDRPAGLYIRYGYFNSNTNTIIWKGPGGNTEPKRIARSGSSSINPSLSAPKQILNPYVQEIPFHIAYNEENQMAYNKLKLRGNWDITQLDEPVMISLGTGYTENYRPSIIAVGDTSSRICWIGERIEEPGHIEKTVVFTSSDNLGRYWTFGSNVNSTSINKMNDRYTIAWAKTEDDYLEYTDSRTLRDIGRITIKGKDVQLSNGTDLTTMRALAFNTKALPYYMQTAQVYTYQAPIKTDEKREGIVSEEDTQVYFSVGDATVDNEQISFVEIPDTAGITSQQTANQYLVSEPFSLTDNSEFLYSVKYGLSDSLAALSMLSGNKSLTFKVELLDAVTNEILGVFDEVTYDQGNLVPYEKVDYQVLTHGIVTRTVKLRLVINSNFNPEYSVAEKYDTENSLAKKSYKQISYKGSLAITEYALDQNYPNPFNPTTTINYQIKEDGLVTLKIYDILGSEVKTLVNEEKTQGRYSHNFNASDLASGVYIYQLRVNDFVSSKKLMLLK